MARKARAVQSHKKKNRLEKRSRHLDRNAPTESSLDVSIIESFAQMDLSDGGPIGRLPNELVKSILVRLDMQKLIHLQVVCKKWQAVICAIGSTKKSLYLTDVSRTDIDGVSLLGRTFKQTDLSTFTRINLKPTPNPSKHFQLQFAKLFPSVEQLVFNIPLNRIILDTLPSEQLITLSFLAPIFDSAQIATLFARINSCTSLKRLDIFAQIKLLPKLVPTFARLEQLSCHRYNFPFIGHDYEDYEDEGLSLVRQLGPNCSRVWIQNFNVTNLTQWHTIDRQWLANLTYLTLDFVQVDQVISLLSECALSLQVLRVMPWSTFENPSVSPQMIEHLSKLSRLTEIGLGWISFDLPLLEEAARKYQLIPLVSIRACDLSITEIIGEKNSNLFTSILSTIFPNVEHLNIDNRYQMDDIEQYMNRFPKLQTHSFNFLFTGLRQLFAGL